MSADQARILAEIAEMLRDISESLLPGEDITVETKLLDDLELQSIGLARLAGRLQAKYGAGANLVPFFTKRDEPLSNLSVGELVEYLAQVLDENGQHTAADEIDALVARLAEHVVGRSPAPGRTFAEEGYTAFDMLRVIGVLEARFGTLSKTLLFDSPTTAELGRHLAHRYGPLRAAHLLAAPAEEPVTSARPVPQRLGSGPGNLAATVADSDDQAVPGLLGGFMPMTDGHRPRNDNAAVLSERAPDAARTLLQLPEGEVEVFTAGDGPPLVMMHPLNVGAGVFARQFASLAGSYRLICMHNPGVGATTWDGDLTLSQIARLQRTVLAELSAAPPFHVLGSSFGGLVAQEFALLYPAQCASLVLVGCSYRLGGGAPGGRRPLPLAVAEEFDLMGISGADQTMQASAAELEQLLLRCESMDTRIGLGYLGAFARTWPNLFEQLPDIVTPTLILHGRHDTVVPAKHAHLLYGAIPDARFKELPRAGHYPCLTHPAEVERLLTPFLAAHPEAPRAGEGRQAPVGALARPAVAARRRSTAPAPPSQPALQRCIIISSGRCGSTMLSNLIADEPETLSVYESLTTLRRHLILMPTIEITGAEYWELMSDPGLQGAASARIGSVPDEACYPASGRWAADPAGVPPILQCTLPRMSVDPDHLFDELAGKVRQFPSQPVTLHHRMLLDLLATMAGRRRWVERSGGSSAVAEPLLAALPELRVVYLTRHIAATARSMSRHSTFQFAAARYEFQLRYGTDPYSPWLNPDRLPDAAELPEGMRRLLPDRVTVDALEDLGRDVGRYEAMCAHMMGSAEQALADLKPRYLHRMRYEDVLAKPVDELTQLGEFLGFADPSGWAAATAGRVRSPRARSPQPA